MGFFDFFKPEAQMLREKIIFTQKHRITKLENELDEYRGHVKKKDEDIDRARNNYDKAKERLVEQIVELSDKFADNNQRMLDIAHENAKLKMLVEQQKHGLVLDKKEAGPKQAKAKKAKK